MFSKFPPFFLVLTCAFSFAECAGIQLQQRDRFVHNFSRSRHWFGESEAEAEAESVAVMVVAEKIKIGVCVMEKKVKCDFEVFSAPMGQIFERLLAFGEFEVGECVRVFSAMFFSLLMWIFGLFMNQLEMADWPVCDCLIAFYSSGYPLEKAEAYAALRKPFLVNELEPQYLLHDRRKVYERLEMFGIPVPRYALVIRDAPYQQLDYFIEEEDFVEVHGMRFFKPFVEKPVDGKLVSRVGETLYFATVGNRSSEFHPEVRRVRREGSYIYEEFMPTGGTDVKVYTVGPEYAHAEARKSPVVDGVVMRNLDGKEVRYPVLLTPAEKEMARDVCIAFSQAVCGFDLLRSQGRSYVCDVNGWSFVKNSYKYYDDSACVLRKMLLDAKAPHLSSAIPPTLPWKVNELVQPSEPLTRQGSGINGSFGDSEELRCVIAVIRHGDRTPKQKVKLKITEEKLLNLMLKYNGGRPRSETKLKSAVQLQDLLDATRMLVPRTRPDRESDSEAEDVEHAEKLRQVKAVLEEGGHFSGIYRKVQLKPLKWVKVTKGNGEVEEQPVEALMVLKYGGVLTHAGRKQAEELGRYFRNKMYPGEGTGLLRLHSTYRHDLKIYSSDEGRVQMSAAAFAKGLLDLEGQLTPILVSLVSKDYSMLDGLENASSEMKEAKAWLNEIITSNANTVDSNGSPEFPWMVDGAGLPPNASELLANLGRIKLGEQSGSLNIEMEEMIISPTNIHIMLADGVIPNEYGINPKQKLKIGSKIARRLLGKLLIDLRNTREEAITVAELKNNHDHSLSINIEKEDAEAKSKLLHKNDEIDQDDDDDKETKYRLDPKYANVKTPERHVRTRLYFTSESHIHSLMNVLRYCNLEESLQEESLVCRNALERLCKTKELDYMSHIVLRMFENTEVALEDPKRYRIELTYSRGADLSPLEKKGSAATSLHQEHTLPIMGPERLQEIGSYLTLETMEEMIRPFAMPAEDFPPATPAAFSGYFSKSVLDRLQSSRVAVLIRSACETTTSPPHQQHHLRTNYLGQPLLCSPSPPRPRSARTTSRHAVTTVIRFHHVVEASTDPQPDLVQPGTTKVDHGSTSCDVTVQRNQWNGELGLAEREERYNGNNKLSKQIRQTQQFRPAPDEQIVKSTYRNVLNAISKLIVKKMLISKVSHEPHNPGQCTFGQDVLNGKY
ncbi:hypothetical protein JHK87_035409 [Glycine soja]|nr:hypothetical protein JHK87_035409 [Glycine soja]